MSLKLSPEVVRKVGETEGKLGTANEPISWFPNFKPPFVSSLGPKLKLFFLLSCI